MIFSRDFMRVTPRVDFGPFGTAIPKGLFLSLWRGIIDFTSIHSCLKSVSKEKVNDKNFSKMLIHIEHYVKDLSKHMYTCIVETTELFSKNLVRLRKAQGLSLRELSAMTGISYRLIHHYENNPQSIPISKLETLAKALKVQIGDFFNYDDTVKALDDLDVRWIKRIKEIQSLSESDRKEINQHINSLLEKSKLKKSTP